MPTEPAQPGMDAVHKPGEKWTSAEHAYRDGFQHGYFAAEQKHNPNAQRNSSWKHSYAEWAQPDATWTSEDHAYQNGFQNGYSAGERVYPNQQNHNSGNQYPMMSNPGNQNGYPNQNHNPGNPHHNPGPGYYSLNSWGDNPGYYNFDSWHRWQDRENHNSKNHNPGYYNFEHWHHNPGSHNSSYGNPGHGNPGNHNPGNPHHNPGYGNPGNHNPGNHYSRKERYTMDGIASDKVNINVGGGGGEGYGYGGGNAGLAAVIAALGNRNQGGDMAALIAALGHRDDRRCDDGGFGFGGGGGILGLVALLGLLRGGIGGHGHKDCDDNHGGLFNATVLSKLGAIEGAIPAVTAAVGDSIAQLALGTQAGFAANQAATASLALGVQQGLANNKDAFQAGLLASLAAIAGVKDSVQNGFALTNTNVLEGVCSVKEVVRDDGDKTRALISSIQDANLQRELTVAQNALSEERHARRVRDVEVTVTQTNQQAQLQAQQQQQQQTLFDQLFKRLGSIEFEQNQIAKNTNANLIIGSTGVATGAQSANPVNVR